MGAFGEHVVAFHMNIAFCALSFVFLLLFFNGQQNFDVHHLVKVANDPVEFLSHIAAQGRCDFQMVTTDRQIHSAPPYGFRFELSASADLIHFGLRPRFHYAPTAPENQLCRAQTFCLAARLCQCHNASCTNSGDDSLETYPSR